METNADAGGRPDHKDLGRGASAQSNYRCTYGCESEGRASSPYSLCGTRRRYRLRMGNTGFIRDPLPKDKGDTTNE